MRSIGERMRGEGGKGEVWGMKRGEGMQQRQREGERGRKERWSM